MSVLFKNNARASYLGVVSFGRFVPDSDSVTMLTVMVNLPYLRPVIGIANRC